MKKRLSFIAVCIVVLALFLGANTLGCGSSNNSWLPPIDDNDPIVDDGEGSENPSTPIPVAYWVSTEGSDDNSGTQAAPFRTMLKATIEAYNSPRDIYVFPGTYEEPSLHIPANVNIIGLGSRTIDPVKYRPVIDMRECSLEHCSLYIRGDENGSETKIDGMRFFAKRIGISAFDTSLMLTNSEISVEGTEIARGLSIYVSAADTADALISNNVITTQDMTLAGSYSYAVEISSGNDGVMTVNILDNTITSGKAADSSVGIMVSNYGNQHQDVLIKGNTIASGATANSSTGIYIESADTSRIEQNIITAGAVENGPNNNEGSTGVLVSGYAKTTRPQSVILNNAIFAGSGSDWTQGISLHSGIDASILYNTIDAGFGEDTSTTNIMTYQDVTSTIQNNILCAGTNDSSYGIIEHEGNMASLKNNLFCTNFDMLYATYPEDAIPRAYMDAVQLNAIGINVANNLVGDPNFVDAAAHDYRLVFPSDAVDAGRVVTGVDHDLAGDARMRGTAPDIGAYELR